MNTIQAEWEKFRKMVLHPEAPEIQIREMEKAFYAGASSTLAILLDIAAKKLSEDAGAEILEGLRLECKEFSLSLKK